MATNIEKKVTKAVKFGMIADFFDRDPDMVVGTASIPSGDNIIQIPVTAQMLSDAMRHEVELLTKKRVSPKETEEQRVRRERGEMLIEYMRDHAGEKFTVTQLQHSVPGFPAEISTSAVTSLFRLPDVVAHHKRTVDKGRAYYQYVE